jgi:cytochrome c5
VAVIVSASGNSPPQAVSSSQSEKTVADGVYTKEQAARGQRIYHRECERCHLADLGGDQLAAPLVGDAFMKQWQASNLGDLLTTVKTTMPPDGPGSVSDDEYAAIVSYLLQMNRFPAGQEELGKDPAELKAISFKRPGLTKQ